MHIMQARVDPGKRVERRLGLRPDQTISLLARPGTVVRCLRGPLWLTQEGEWRDYILVEGSAFVSGSSGRIVVSALDSAGEALVLAAGDASAGNPAPGLYLSDEALESAHRNARKARNKELARLLGLLVARVRRWVQRIGRAAGRRLDCCNSN